MPSVLKVMRDRRGASLVEFALLLPVLAAILYGMLAYGQYFLIAHSVQQLANDAARATVGGTTTAERHSLALGSVTNELPHIDSMPPDRVTTSVDEVNGLVTVRVRFDASQIGLFRSPLVPMPDPVIERRAVIHAQAIS